MKSINETVMKFVFLAAACTSVLAVALICIFLFANGIPAMAKIGLPDFLFGMKWKPSNGLYGIFPFILGSIYVTAGAIVVGVPTALLLAIFLAFYCPKKLYAPLKAMVNLLAGIPSVVYGFFGLTVFVPLLRQLTGHDGSTMLTASVLLGIMILPTVTGVAEPALKSVPTSYYEGALALGATKETAVFKTIVPAAKSGIITSLTLGVGRAIGETMAVKMIVGNQTRLPESIFDGVRTLTSNIVLEMGYATDLHKEALIATGVILFGFILILNMIISILKRKQVEA